MYTVHGCRWHSISGSLQGLHIHLANQHYPQYSPVKGEDKWEGEGVFGICGGMRGCLVYVEVCGGV